MELHEDTFTVPAGGVVMLPPGSTLRYISPAAHGAAAAIPANRAEYIELPANAVLLPPTHDDSFSLNNYLVDSLEGGDIGGRSYYARSPSGTGLARAQRPPEIWGLGGYPLLSLSTPVAINSIPHSWQLTGAEKKGFAMVAHSSLMDVSPVVLYTGDTFLFDADAPQGVRDEVVSFLPAGTRGDIFGNITRREAGHLPVGLMPSDTAAMLRNFPMLYAVAEDCRAGAVRGGPDCAEGDGEGLEFTVGVGEDVVLEEPIIAGGNIFISVYSDIDANPVMDAEVYTMREFYDTGVAGSSAAATVVFVAPNGAVQALAEPALTANPNDIVLLSLPATAAEDAEIRVYMNIDAAHTAPADVTAGDLENAHYAVLPAVTLYAGGFTAATTTNIAAALGQLAISTTINTEGLSNLRLGFNANINDGQAAAGEFFRKPYFGENSYIEDEFGGTPFRVPLENYALASRPADVSLTIRTASRYANFDTAGEIISHTDTGDRLAVTDESLEFLPDSANVVPAETPDVIMLDIGQGIPMQQGYLWQGYLNPNNQDVELNIAPANDLTAGGEWETDMFARVHPADELLNFWGSGLERAEGMDSRSIARRPRADIDDVYTFNIRNFSSSEQFGPVPTGTTATPEIRPIALAAPDGGTDGGRYFNHDIYWRGFRSPIVTGAGAMRVRVRNAATGEVLHESLAGEWVPRARSGNRDAIPGTSTHTADLSDGFVPWGGPNAAPFHVPDQAFASNSSELWAHRRMVDLDGGTTTDEDSILLVDVGGTMVSARFNMPAFPLRSYSFRPRPAWEFGKAAEIGAIPLLPGERALLPACTPGTDPDDYLRVPGALLGRSPDVLRPPAGLAGEECITPGFSGRLRRESVLTGLFAAATETLNLETYRLDSHIGDTSQGYNISTAVIDNIARPATRRTLPADPADTPANAEVRAAEGNAPADFNLGIGTASPNLQNPESYVETGNRIQNTVILTAAVSDDMRENVAAAFSVPLHSDLVFYMDRAYNTIALDGYDDTARNISVATDCTGTPDTCGATAPIAADPYPEVMLPPPQTLSLGANFRITGPGALVPPFGGRRADSTADVYAARSRLFYGVLANDADGILGTADDDPNFQLHNVYSAANYQCTPSAVGANGANCAAMQNPANAKYWIPMISGVMAFEAVEINPTPAAGDTVAEAAVNDIRLIIPQPRTEVMDNASMPTTVYAGSILYPRTGMVVPSVPFTVGGRLVAPDGAVAAVDVNPATPPVPVRYVRRHATFRAWDMPLPPVLATDDMGTEQYIVEPLGFARDVLVNFREWQVNDDTGFLTPQPPAFRIPRSCEGASDTNFDSCRYDGWDSGAPDSNFGRFAFMDFSLQNPDYPLNVSATVTVRYDGTFARGFLANDKMTRILSEYYSGENIFTRDNDFTTFFPRRGYQHPGDTGMQKPGDRTTTQRFGYHRRNTGGLMEGDPPAAADEMSYNAPDGNTAAELGNPLSWHWIQRNPAPATAAFVPMGVARQFYFYNDENLATPPPPPDYFGDANAYFGDAATPGVPFGVSGPGNDQYDYGCGYPNLRRYDAGFPAYPTADDGFLFAELPCLGAPDARNDEASALELPGFHNTRTPPTPPNTGRLPEDFGRTRGGGGFYPVGVLAGSSAAGPNAVFFRDGREIERDEDEFFSLRLPHLIEIPAQSEMTIFAGVDQPTSQVPPYPMHENNFFQFPDGSVANILQVDAASWESVHPFVSRYLPGAVLANDGGVYPVNTAPGDALAALTDNTRNALAAAEQMEVREDNDGHRRVDVGGRRVMHYAKSESIPGSYTYSSTPVHTNVWIRLPEGGHFIENGTDRIIQLRPNSVVNPILGTYMSPPEEAAPARPPLRSNYQALLEASGTLTVARPALIIPAGATVRVGAAGANITNVKAAAIFSIKPIEGVSCPNGMVDDMFPQIGLAATVTISQMREGVSENEFDETGADGVFFTLGHPCAWADDSENTDGDRFFVYRSRRRYWDDTHQTRIRSNDRTYLLGGRLHLLT